MNFLRWITALVAATLLLAACGGGANLTKANLRLVNASSGYAKLDFSVDSTLRQGGVSYGDLASYVEIDPGKADSVISSAGSATALLSFTPAVTKKSYYTVLAYGGAGALNQLLLDDNVGAPDTNRALLRVVNAAPDAGALDIYLTGSDDLLSASVAVQAGAAVGVAGNWLTVTSSTWRLRITAAGSKTDVRLDVSGLALGSKQITTLVLTPSRGGALVNALLMDQQGAIAHLDNTQARVRVAAGVADSAGVSATVGGTTLLTNTASPVVGLYTLTAAGTQNVVVGVNGATLPTTTYPLLPGADYTLLVYGTVSAPVVSWITDDNRLPADASQARLRLVNGVASSGVLALTVDLVPVADSVAAGTGSAYSLITPTTTAKLAVSGAGLSTPFTAVDQIFVAGANYTVFVLGAPTAAAGTLRKDR